LLAATAVTAALAACSDDERPARPGLGGTSGASGRSGNAGTGASSGAGAADGAGGGGTAGRGGRDGGAADSGGTSGDGGRDDAGPAVCGNGVAEGNEGCDGTDVRQQTCQSYGFESGSLGCDECSVDFVNCSGTENCADGRDNDGDQRVDCADVDCQAGCQNACSAPLVLPDPALSVVGQTNGHGATITPGCSTGSSGPETVYRFSAARSGVLDVQLLSTGANLNLSLRGACGDDTSELGCSEKIAGQDAVERLRIPITQGQTVFIVVDGTGAATAGRYTLDALSRVIQCGDAYRDTGEECDDGNRSSSDGCSADCRLEPDEGEPNGTTGEADPYNGFPYFAAIGSAGDVDVFSVAVASAGSTITAETFDLGDGSCAQDLLDSTVEILAPNGSTVLASDNDSGDGLCSVATARGVGAGTHFVRVRASTASATFPYVLNVSVMP
jgi:cysteine-rich repeat protein